VIGTEESYRCAPQLFYFRPQGKWYLIHQWKDRSVTPANYGPCWSTLESPSKLQTLTRPVMLFTRKPAHVPRWIDFWVICDDVSAYLFFTGDDGAFWRSRTPLASFPAGWAEPQLVLKQVTNEFFEATHTYRLKGMAKYLTLVEAIGPQSRRYYKAYLADRLDGDWKPVAGSWDQPFASVRNVTFAPGVAPWTESISHGDDLLRRTSSELQVQPGLPPCFLWHTGEDKMVPVDHSLLFAAALQQHGVPHELHIYQRGDHGTGLMGSDHPWMHDLLFWLRAQGFVE
jgi:hypothetical protein